MANKVVRQSSKCANCVAEKSRFLKQKSNKKLVGTRSILNFLYLFLYRSHYKTCWHIVWNIKKYRKCKSKSIKNKKNGTTMLSSKCAVCSCKKSIFLKEQETKGLLSSLRIKTLLSNIPLLGKILF